MIGVLAVLMLIPLDMIEGLIAERASRRAEAVASVQASFAGQQTVALPFFVWPYVEHWTEQTVDAGNRVGIKQMSESKQLVWFAEQSQATAEVAVKNDRYRGIHRVRTYESTIAISGAATWPDRSQVKPSADGRRIVWGDPRLVLPIADVRGLRGSPMITWMARPSVFAKARSCRCSRLACMYRLPNQPVLLRRASRSISNSQVPSGSHSRRPRLRAR